MSASAPLPTSESTIGASILEEGVIKEELGFVVPKCMATRPEIDPVAAPLTKEEYKEAKAVLVKDAFIKYKFPRVTRVRKDPPISGQTYYVFAFTPSAGAKADPDGCFGVMKFRGAFANQTEAYEKSEYLVRVIDSVNENFIGYVGHEFPITADAKYCEETKEVDVKNKMDTVSKEHFKKIKEKEQSDIEEIQSKEKALLDESKDDKKFNKEDLEFYTTLRVKYANLRMAQVENDRKTKEIVALVERCKRDILTTDAKHPTYMGEFMGRYTAALKSAGIDSDKSPLIKYLAEPLVLAAGSDPIDEKEESKIAVPFSSPSPLVSVTETPSGIPLEPLNTQEKLQVTLKALEERIRSEESDSD